MRRFVVTALAASLVLALVPPAMSRSGNVADDHTITLDGAGALLGPDAPEDLTVAAGDPTGRARAWLPQEPGTKKWLTLDYGPYLIHPGADLSRMDVELWGADGHAVGFIPSVVDVNGEEISSHTIHIHHAHWLWLDPDAPGTHRWFYGTGEERTQGSILPAAKADPRYKDGMRYGIQVSRGDRIGFLSMLHNKTAEPLLVYLRVKIQFIYGTASELKEAKGWEMHPLTPVLIGSTFHVPLTGEEYVFPLDATKRSIGEHSNYSNPVAAAEIKPGVGQVFTSPWNGTIVIGAGHSHPGAHGVVLSNMGSPKDPCAEDGDRFPGVTAAYSRNITRNGVFPSEEFQMGLTQPGWRLHVRKGDRLVLNGVYDPEKYAFPDAMSYFGFYLDRSDETTRADACKVELLGDPDASRDEISWTVPNQKWPEHHAMPTCTKCDEPGPKPDPGLETNVVHIAGHQYLPGNLGFEGAPLGPPVVTKGETLSFVNEDYAEGAVRHSITTCKAPCNGPYTVNYPFHDGVIDSGPLGYTWEDAYVSSTDEPRWDLDTTNLQAGYYTYYCRLHAWMRGSFYIKK